MVESLNTRALMPGKDLQNFLSLVNGGPRESCLRDERQHIEGEGGVAATRNKENDRCGSDGGEPVRRRLGICA